MFYPVHEYVFSFFITKNISKLVREETNPSYSCWIVFDQYIIGPSFSHFCPHCLLCSTLIYQSTSTDPLMHPSCPHEVTMMRSSPSFFIGHTRATNVTMQVHTFGYLQAALCRLLLTMLHTWSPLQCIHTERNHHFILILHAGQAHAFQYFAQRTQKSTVAMFMTCMLQPAG